jgi:endonuclease/exonuclease/phosphatase family metal-dependent hydrolase
MKAIKTLVTAAFLLALVMSVSDSVQAQVATDTVRVMTFNIRYDTPNDNENAWPHRREAVAELIDYFAPDILGVQEALMHQYGELRDALPGYTTYGVGRDDGEQGGESAPIFVRADRFNVIERGTFWLSTTPEVPSVGWDAALPRIASWLRLQDKQSGARFLVVNTHFDHLGVEAREESSKLLREWFIANAQDGENKVLTGDFNTPPSSVAFAALVAGGHLRNTRAISKTPPYGPAGTFTAFDINRSDEEPIDHVFVGVGFDVLRHVVVTQHSGGRLPSDHYPVMTDLRYIVGDGT